jgi:hypothetical protein
MNKIAFALITLAAISTGALASQRNNDETTARLFFNGADQVSTVTSPLAAASDEAAGTAIGALINRAMDRQNGDDNR